MSGSKFVDKSAEYTSVRVGKQLVKLHNTSVVGRLFKVQNNAFSLCTITETSSVWAFHRFHTVFMSFCILRST